MAFYVYILRCADGLYYTGQTEDLDVRLAQHKSGQLKGFTSLRLPVELMWCEAMPTREEARDAEYRIKRWSRAKKEALFRGDWDAVGRAAVPPREREARFVRVSTSLDMHGSGAIPSFDPSMSSEVETPTGP